MDAFIEELIKLKFGQTELSPEMRKDITADITSRLNQYMTLRLISEVSRDDESKVEELHQLILTNPSAEKVSEYISSHVSEPDVLVGQILTDFKALYLGAEPKQNN